MLRFMLPRVVRQSRGMGSTSTSASRPPPAQAGTGVVDAQVDMLYRRNFIPSFAGVPYGALVCAVAWRTVPHAWLLAWFAVKVTIAAARVLLDMARRQSDPGVPATWWATRYVVALVLDGLTWTLLPVLAGPTHDLRTNVVMIASVIGVGGIGAVVLSTDFRANVAFSVALLLPAALWEAVQGSRLSLFAGVAMLVFLGLILEQGRRAARDIAQLLRLRFEIAQARDRALDAARSRSDFLATMSHELRTPLNAVIGMAGLLADSGMTEEQRERVDVIRVSSRSSSRPSTSRGASRSPSRRLHRRRPRRGSRSVTRLRTGALPASSRTRRASGRSSATCSATPSSSPPRGASPSTSRPGSGATRGRR